MVTGHCGSPEYQTFKCDCNILDSDHLPIKFHIMDRVKVRYSSEPIEKFTDWDRFQSLSSDLISLRLEINTEVVANKLAREFTASIGSA
jgi:hypothetical protein